MSEVLSARTGAVVTLTLNRPQRRNALDPILLRALANQMGQAEDDPSIRVVVVTGAGTAFSAGADLDWMRASRELSLERNLADARMMRDAFETVDGCRVAVIARVNGPAMGGGAGLVACADFAVASEDARFAFSEARLGLIPAAISPYVLRALGSGETRARFTSGLGFDAHEALRVGLVHRVVPASDLDAAVDEACDAFLASGPTAVADAKRLVREATASFMLPDLPERIARTRTTAEAQEGIDAFLEKRHPSWHPSADS